MEASFRIRNPITKEFEDAASLVHPNPELKGDEEKLASVDIDGVAFKIEGGSDVIPNPEGEATVELKKIKIGDVVFSIPEGGETYEAIETTEDRF